MDIRKRTSAGLATATFTAAALAASTLAVAEPQGADAPSAGWRK